MFIYIFKTTIKKDKAIPIKLFFFYILFFLPFDHTLSRLPTATGTRLKAN